MKNEVLQIANRIKELREILEIDNMAEKLGISEQEYADYENGECDIPVGVLFSMATELNVDPTVLLTGEAPRMNAYSIVRAGHGVSVERFNGYEYSALATNYIKRDMDPMIVALSPSENKPKLVTHPGQEFNYVLEGEIEITLGGRSFLLKANDSIYFDPTIPHGQAAFGGNAKFLTVINE